MTSPALDRALARIPMAYAGPGGAIAALRDGEILVRHSWGWADRERRLPFTPATLFRVCSISKQFTCAAMLDNFPDPATLDHDIAARLPLLEGAGPATIDLANNQSGLRDYWATAMLCGSPVEAPFGEAEARSLIARTRTLQFAPGTRYSYCNHNFRLIGDAIAERTGRPLAELMAAVFARAGMATARLHADTATMPDGTIGYEGTVESGFRPAVNRIIWTGDAGVVASLDDMIAWERHIDATRDDAGALYSRLAAAPHFRDGTAAQYGLGLNHSAILGHPATSHGGGLRGWRSFRFYLPAERISVVALFNHMADPRAAALELLATLIEAPAKPAPAEAPVEWTGAFTEPETGLVVRLETQPDHRVRLHYTGHAELMDQFDGGIASNGGARLRRTPEGIVLERASDNLSSVLVPCGGEAPVDVTGSFHSAEYDADLTCIDAGGALYAAFSGEFGPGLMEPLIPVAPDLWRLPFPRALDHSPPGDWTLAFQRGAGGQVTGVRVGCWLARRIDFSRS